MSSSAARPMTIVEAERRAIIEAMRYTMGNKEGAAFFLGIGKSTLYRKIEDFAIKPQEYSQDGGRA